MFEFSQRIKATFLSPFCLKTYVHTHTYVFVYTYICVCISVWTIWTIWLQVNAIKGKFFNFLAKGIKIQRHSCCSCYCCCCRYYQCAQQSNSASNAGNTELPQKLPCFVFCCISFFFLFFSLPWLATSYDGIMRQFIKNVYGCYDAIYEATTKQQHHQQGAMTYVAPNKTKKK